METFWSIFLARHVTRRQLSQILYWIWISSYFSNICYSLQLRPRSKFNGRFAQQNAVWTLFGPRRVIKSSQTYCVRCFVDSTQLKRRFTQQNTHETLHRPHLEVIADIQQLFVYPESGCKKGQKMFYKPISVILSSTNLYLFFSQNCKKKFWF